MRSVWSCPACALLLLFALVGRDASAAHAGREWRDVHWVAKAQVTAHLGRRDEGTCPSEYTMCPASLSGGCCPSLYACATDSCYATTTGPTSACGSTGLYACAAVGGGVGCCPIGYICADGDACIPPAGVAASDLHCPSDYYLCPSSLNYGCCPTGMGCAADACYSTAPVTTTVLQTVTTTSGTHTLTTTQTAVTVATPSPPTGLPTDNTNAAAKFIPTTVPKVPASSPTSESSGGLSGGAIGGLIAGVVILLIVVVVAAFLIIRRLKRAEAAWASKQGSSSGKKTKSQSQAQMEHYGRQLHSDMDDMSVDPLMVHPNANTNASGTPQPGFDATRGRSDSTGFSASPNAFPPYMDDRSRHASPDSNAGHFDLPARVHNIPGGASAYPQHQSPMQPARIRSNTADSANTYHGYAYHHWRQQSNASELSADGSDHGGAHASVLTPLVPAAAAGATGTISELEASKGYFAELPGTHHRSNSDDFTPGGRGYGHARRPSDGFRQPQQSMPPPGQTSPTVGLSGLGLSTLDETAEMRGYSDGAGQQAGQTAAGFTAAQAGWAAAAQGQAQGQTQRPGPPGPGPGTGTGA